MSKGNVAVAIFNTHVEAENAVKELQKSDFDMKKLSIVGRDYHTEEQVVGYYHTGDRMKYWGKLGAFWGGLWGVSAQGTDMGFGGNMETPGYQKQIFPPWSHGKNNPAIDKGLEFTVPEVDNLPDFHGSIDNPMLRQFFPFISL